MEQETAAKAATVEARKSRVLSGAMPTGGLHIGNYLGALTRWVQMQHDYETFFCVVDLHAITTQQDPKELREATREVISLYLAAGLDPKISTVFVQSHVPAHAEMCWILNCVTPMGWLERMTQFKEKAGKERERASVGLFDYPILQAADILLYGDVPPRSLFVPVGEDQKQHVELCRDIAIRFNRLYGETLSIAAPIIPETGARIMGLDDPTKKMSKSVKSRLHAIYLLDAPDDIRRKIGRAVTDPGTEIKFDPRRPGLYNLLTIYERLSEAPRAEIEERFAGKGYSALKQELAELVIETLRPLQERYNQIRGEAGYLDGILADGAARAGAEASKVLGAVKSAVGLG